MSDTQLPDTLREAIVAEIAIVPLEEEVNDFEAVSAVENVTADVFSEVQALPDYTAHLESDTTRSMGIIVLLGEVVHQVIAQKDVLIAFLQAGTAVVGVLSKQRRVNKIDLSLDGDSISIENPDTVTVQKLLDTFMAKHPAFATNITPSSKLQVTATVSKKTLPAGR
jgi:hypothetical protein